jgi:pimeloyl-ACP methyl ester carboxylesterase
MPFLDAGGVRLFFTDSKESTAAGAPPIVFVHGWTCDSHDWVFQLDPFEARHRVIAVDLRGHGRSSAPARDYTAQRYAEDLVVLIEHLELDPVVVIGHSLGGSVAAALAVEHPELVRAMVSVEPAYGQDEATVEWMRGAAQQFGDEAGSELAAQLQGATEPHTPTWLKTWHRRRAIGMNPALLKQSFVDMYFSENSFSGQPKTDPYLARRSCPILAFHRLPAMAAWEHKVMQHAYSRVVSWEGAGHWLHQERPIEFNAIALAWIADLPGFAAESAPRAAMPVHEPA